MLQFTGKLLDGISGMTVINTCLSRIPQKTYAGPYADFWKGGGANLRGFYKGGGGVRILRNFWFWGQN